MEASTQCIVVFPIYQSINEIEKAFFEQGICMTEGYKKVFVAPKSFILDDSFSSFRDLDVIRFDDSFFVNIEGYNLLMLSEEFYTTFSDYDYILVHQSDVYLFEPKLKYWCDKGYDYIGAPWLKPNKFKKSIFYRFILNYFPKLYPAKKRKLHECYNNVGNGGLSLRKVKTFLSILKSPKSQKVLELYKDKLVSESLYNEDIFWSVEGHRLFRDFKKPTWQEALHFAIETHPKFSYRFIGNRLPFGCHAPFVYEPDFWKKYIIV